VRRGEREIKGADVRCLTRLIAGMGSRRWKSVPRSRGQLQMNSVTRGPSTALTRRNWQTFRAEFV
jgi:hypothetical protein